MRKAVHALAGLAAFAALGGCNEPAANQEEGGGAANASANAGAGDAKAAVEQVEQAVLEAFQAKDLNRLAGYYGEDATVMMAGQAPAKGGEEIKKSLAGFMSDPNFSLSFDNESTRIAGSGDLAYTRGTYTVSYTNPQTKQKQSERGSYVSVFEKAADGSWKIIEDIATPGGGQQQGG